jgi:ribonuclease-3
MMAGALGLEYCILLGAGQRRAVGEVSRRILADAYESLAGAVFLDAGYDMAEKCFSADLSRAIQRTTDAFDFKTQLQERCHLQGIGQPMYQVTSTDGPEHARVFSCEVSVDGVVVGSGVARSKKLAEQTCARIAADVLEVGAQLAAPALNRNV